MVEKVLELNTHKNIFWTLVGVLVLCIGFYMYCVSTTVQSVVMRQKLESQATALTLALGNEEFKYISLRGGVTLSLAYSLGFRDTDTKQFISKNPMNYISYLSR